MITENIPNLKIHKLTKEQYDKALAAGKINATEIYLTPVETNKTFSDAETITLADGTYYIANANISSLTINYPTGNFIASVEFTTSTEGSITISLPGETKYIGGVPEFKNNERWELNIRNGVIVGGLIE